MNEDLPVAMQIAVLAIQLGIILFAARIFGRLAQKFNVPSVLGELIAGVVIGPYLLGGIGLPLHGFAQGVFRSAAGGGIPVSTPLYALATLGSIVLLFMSGLETDLRMFFRYSVVGTIVGLGGVIFSFGFGDVLGMWMFRTGFMDPRCLFLGILCTATSVGITARILSEKKSIDSPEGTTILAAAVIDDVLGIICLAVVMGIVGASSAGGAVSWGGIGLITLKSVGIWLGVTAAGLMFAHKIAQFLKIFPPSGLFAVLAMGLALLVSGFFEEAGLAMIVGAYVTGLCLSKTDIAFSVRRHLGGVYNFLVPVFFVVMGMLVDVRVFADPFVLKYGLIYSVLAILAKIIGCALPSYFMNFNLLGSLRIGTGMIPRGEVALIIAGIGSTTMMIIDGEKVPIVNPELFGIAIIMTLVTTIAAPPLLAIMLAVKGKGVRKDVTDAAAVHSVYTLPSDIIRDFVVGVMLDNFRHEGFRHSELDREGGLTHFRRENTTFTLLRTGNVLNFESQPGEVPLIRTVMYETFVEIHHSMGKLKDLAEPVAFDKALFDGNPAVNCASVCVKTPFRISDILPPAGIIVPLKAETGNAAVEELVDALASAGLLKDAPLCKADVSVRESISATCLPGGIALPHARTDGTDKLIAAVGVSAAGCAADGGKTHIFVLSLCPKNAERPYLQFVAHVAGVLTDKANIDAIMNASTPGGVRKIFIG